MQIQFPNTVWDGTTPTRKISTEFAAPDGSDWDQLVGELQAAQTAILDTGNSSIALSNSWTQKSTYGTVSYRKIGNEVQMSGGATAGTVTDGTTILTLPAGFRPTNPRSFDVAPAGSDTIGSANGTHLLLGTDGTVKIYSATGAVSIDFSSVRFHTGD